MKPFNNLFKLVYKRGNLRLAIYLVGAIGVVFITSTLNILLPLSFKKLLSNIELAKFNELQYLLLYYSGLYVSIQIVEGLRMFFVLHLEQKVFHILSLHTFKHLHQLPYTFHTNQKVGSIINIVNNGITAFTSTIKNIVLPYLSVTLELIGISILVWSFYSFKLLAIILLFILLFIFIVIFGNSLLHYHRQQLRDMNVHNSGFYADNLTNYVTIKLFNKEKYMTKQYNKLFHTFWKVIYKFANKNLLFTFIGSLLVGLVILLVLYFSIRDIRIGLSTVGDFVLINAYLLRLIRPLKSLSFIYRNFRMDVTKIEKFVDLLEISTHLSCITVNNSNKNLQLTPSIVFNKVNFSYENKSVFKDLSFELSPGKTLGILGPSGVGKSSIVSLLAGLVSSQSGSIYIGDFPIQNIPRKQLMKYISIVPQDILLFNDSIYKNISFGCEDAKDEEVKKVSKMTFAHEFISNMPNGYSTIVGERGSKLSGGERQRIGIARALLKKEACIYIFDEPTSFLDNNTANLIRGLFKSSDINKSCLIISHNVKDLKFADKIIHV